MTTAAAGQIRRLLIISPKVGSLSEEIQRKLGERFPGYLQLEFDPRRDFRRRITAGATVVVAGGDGTVGYVTRALAGSKRKVGILPLGTFNNFAGALGIPEDIDAAIAVVRARKTRAVTLGRINGRPFLEAGAIGLFGEAILLGDKAKDLQFGRLDRELRAVAGAEAFDYTMTGDIEGRGRARSNRLHEHAVHRSADAGRREEAHPAFPGAFGRGR